MKFNYQGFTLIELLVVVAILGILASVGVVSYQGYTWSAQKKSVELNLNTILLSNEEYTSDHGKYYYSKTCNDSEYGKIQDELLNEKEVLEELAEDWKFCVEGDENNQTLNINASHKTKTCTITLTDKMAVTRNGSDC